MTSQPRLGAALRTIRRERSWTLAELSRRTGLSISTLSKVERDHVSLTYEKLLQLTEGAGIDIGALFAPDPASNGSEPSARRSINRRGDGQHVATPIYDYWYLSADVLRKKFVPMLGTPRARTIEEFGELVTHAGEEFVFVLEGAIEVRTAHYAPFVLRSGESAYLDSTMGHAYLKHGSGRCRVLAICSAGETELKTALTAASKPRRTRSRW